MTRRNSTRRNIKVSAVRCLFLALALVCLAGSSWAAAEGESESKGKIAERYSKKAARIVISHG